MERVDPREVSVKIREGLHEIVAASSAKPFPTLTVWHFYLSPQVKDRTRKLSKLFRSYNPYEHKVRSPCRFYRSLVFLFVLEDTA